MRHVALPVAVAAALLVGCGGDGDSENPPAPQPGKTLSKAQFVSQMDSVCRGLGRVQKAYSSRLERVDEDASQSAAFDQIAVLLDKYLPRQKAQVEKIRALKPPDAERTFHETYLETQDDSLALARRFQDAVRREDVAALDPLQKDVDRVQARRAGIIAGHGGFKHCGDDGE